MLPATATILIVSRLAPTALRLVAKMNGNDGDISMPIESRGEADRSSHVEITRIE